MIYLFLAILAGVIGGMILPLRLFLVLMIGSVILFRRNGKMIFFLAMVMLFFYLYTQSCLSSFDLKYAEGEYQGYLRVQSSYGENDYYFKYLCKNESGD